MARVREGRYLASLNRSYTITASSRCCQPERNPTCVTWYAASGGNCEPPVCNGFRPWLLPDAR